MSLTQTQWVESEHRSLPPDVSAAFNDAIRKAMVAGLIAENHSGQTTLHVSQGRVCVLIWREKLRAK